MNYVCVFLGGGAGACCRFAIGQAKALAVPSGFPYATLIVNVSGSLLIGFVGALLVGEKNWEGWRPLLLAGFLGGYTTFSAFSGEVLKLVQDGKGLMAGTYVGLSIVLSLTAVWVGTALGRQVG